MELMSLPPIDPKNTQRGYIYYTSGGKGHTASFRFEDAATESEITAALNAVATKMFPLMDSADNITGGAISAKDSNVRFPLTGIVTGNGTASGGVNNPINRTISLGITGKGTDGHLVDAFFFTILGAAYTATRVAYAALASNVQEWIDVIRANEESPIVNIGAAPVSWNGYMNVRRNSYWQTQER